MKRRNSQIESIVPSKRSKYYEKDLIHKLFNEYDSFNSCDGYSEIDYWGCAFNQDVIKKQIEIFKSLSNREKLIIQNYKDGHTDLMINNIKRGRFRQVRESFKFYVNQRDDRIYTHHPFFPLMIDDSFDDEVLNNHHEMYKIIREKYNTKEIMLYFRNLGISEYVNLAFQLTDKFFEIMNKFSVLEYPLRVYRGDTIKWRSGQPKVIPGVTSTSLHESVARGFLQDSIDRCCLWNIIILPGIKAVFLDKVLQSSGFKGGEAEVIFLTSGGETLTFISDYEEDTDDYEIKRHKQIKCIVTPTDIQEEIEDTFRTSVQGMRDFHRAWTEWRVHKKYFHGKIIRALMNNGYKQGDFAKLIYAFKNEPKLYNKLVEIICHLNDEDDEEDDEEAFLQKRMELASIFEDIVIF